MFTFLFQSRKSLPVETSAAELSDLIHKMTRRQSTENALISFPENAKNDCPLHGNNACQFVQEQIVAIDVVEALRYFNVPNEIVKVLRTYYSFLKTEVDLNDIKEDRYERSIDTFLKEFEAMVSNVNASRRRVLLKLCKRLNFLYLFDLYCRI